MLSTEEDSFKVTFFSILLKNYQKINNTKYEFNQIYSIINYFLSVNCQN